MDYWPFLLNALPEALKRVPEVYYRAPIANAAAVQAVLAPNDPRVAGVAEISFRHGERAFCYELYHHLRLHLDHVQRNIPEWDGRLVLQGELQKRHLEELARDYFEVQKLDKEYIPDFLLHVPGNFELQEVVIEVKTDPFLRFAAIQSDVEKLQQFIARYRYKIGVFLTVNTSADELFSHFHGEARQRWLRKVQVPDQIYVVCSAGPDDAPVIKTLSALRNA